MRPDSHAAQPPAGAELALPALNLAALARRAAVPMGLLLAAGAGLLVAGGPLGAFADALGRAANADPRWVAAAVGLELLSFAGGTALLALVGGRRSSRLGRRASLEITLGGAAATRLLPTGGAGGVALTVWALRQAGLDARAAACTLLTFLVLLYTVFLGAIAVAGGLSAFGIAGADAPVALSALPAGCALAAMALAGLVARRRAAADPLGGGVRDAAALVRSGDLRLLGAPAWWAFDCAVLWSMLHALGSPPALALVALAFLLGQVANTVPVPGAVSGGTAGVLLAFGVAPGLALGSVLAYRAVAVWLPMALGLVALGSLRRTAARWAREDAAGPQVVAAGGPALPGARPARRASNASMRRTRSRSRGRWTISSFSPSGSCRKTA